MKGSLIVYLVGIMLFGLFYEIIKGKLGNSVILVLSSILFLGALRLLGMYFDRRGKIKENND